MINELNLADGIYTKIERNFYICKPINFKEIKVWLQGKNQ